MRKAKKGSVKPEIKIKKTKKVFDKWNAACYYKRAVAEMTEQTAQNFDN